MQTVAEQANLLADKVTKLEVSLGCVAGGECIEIGGWVYGGDTRRQLKGSGRWEKTHPALSLSRILEQVEAKLAE